MYKVTISGTDYEVNGEVLNLILLVSKERDNIKSAVKDVIDLIEGDGVPNIKWILSTLKEAN